MKRKKFRGLFFFFAVFLMAIALTACGGGKTEGDGGGAPNDTGKSSVQPSYGGSVVVGITQDLDSLDPHKAVAAGTKEVLFNVFEGLVKPDKDGNLVDALAAGHKISEDGKVYTFTLRENVSFHDGSPVTAEDVVYSIQRCAGLLDTTEEEGVVLEPALSNVASVTAKDEKTVELVLKEGDTELLGYLTCAVIPKDYREQDKKPVGTGPFRFVSYAPLQSFAVEKNEDYWNKELPYLDKVTFKIASNTDSAFMELKSGGIDIFPYLTDDQAGQLSGDMAIEEGNMNLVQGLFLNNGRAPFDNKKVREALNYAVDKQGIIDMVAGGKGTVIGSNMFPGLESYYDASLADYYTYDPEKARELLAQAGYTDGSSFTITVPSNYPFHVATAQILAEQLKAAGINAKIQQIEWSQWLKEVYKERNYEATIIGLDANLAPRDLIERYRSGADNNFVNYENKSFDSVLTDALQALDEGVKAEKYKELQRILCEDAASVYIQDPALLVAVNKKLGGYTFYPVYVQDMARVYYKE